MKQLSIIAAITVAIVAIVAMILWRSGLQAPDERAILPTARQAASLTPVEPTVAPTAAVPTPTAPSTIAARRMLPTDRDQPVRYVALGDSSVYGVGASSPEQNYVSRLAADLRAIYPRAQVTNLGVPGATAADVAGQQVERAVAARPDLITLSVGPNDITQGRGVEAYERDLDTILRRLTEETDAVIVVNLIPDLALAPRFSGAMKEQVGRQTARFNMAIERATRSRDVVVVDLYTSSQQEIPDHPEQLSADNYHPSDAGYARWAELFWHKLQARIPA